MDAVLLILNGVAVFWVALMVLILAGVLSATVKDRLYQALAVVTLLVVAIASLLRYVRMEE